MIWVWTGGIWIGTWASTISFVMSIAVTVAFASAVSISTAVTFRTSWTWSGRRPTRSSGLFAAFVMSTTITRSRTITGTWSSHFSNWESLNLTNLWKWRSYYWFPRLDRKMSQSPASFNLILGFTRKNPTFFQNSESNIFLMEKGFGILQR